MPDSISVIGPGWKASDNNYKPVTDGVLSFFDAGTNNPLEVFSDADLTVSLGTTVNCNSTGYPVSSSNVRTLIYTGSTSYKIRLSSVIQGGTLWEHDNVKGALDTSGFLTDEFRSGLPVENVSANRNVGADDNGKLINVNCTSGTLTMTIADASTLGNDWHVGFRHDGTANFVKIIGDGADLFANGMASTTGFSLVARGHTVWLTCDGVGFKIYSEFPPLIGASIPMITVADRLSTPPGSPDPGQRYIVTSSPLGAWSTFAEHDIAEADGFGGWFKYTPPSNCGWIGYVQDEQLFYRFRGSAWLPPLATDTYAGIAVMATTAVMETGTSTTEIVSPGRQHKHLAHPKVWAYVTYSGGTPTLAASYNVASITDGGTGVLEINFTTAFSSTLWADAISSLGAVAIISTPSSKTASSININTYNAAGAALDAGAISFIGWGDQ